MCHARRATAIALILLLPAMAGAQQFDSAMVSSGGGSPEAITSGDLDGDGFVDVATTDISESQINIWVGIPGIPEAPLPIFSEIANVPVGGFPADVIAKDLDGDSILDLLVANATSDEVTLFKGSGDSSLTFTPETTVEDAGKRPTGLAIGDFNGDHHDDIVVANEGTPGTTGTMNVLFGDGTGNFTNCCPTPDTCLNVPVCPTVCVKDVEPLCGPIATESMTDKVAIGLINGDQFLDVLALNVGSNDISVFFGDGTGRFHRGTSITTGPEPRDLKLADLNGDGKLDIITTQIAATDNSTPDAVAVMLGNGDGTFGARTIYETGADPRQISIGDVNGDGLLDLVVANNRSVDVSVFFGDGTGKLSLGRRYVADSQPMALTLIPFDDNSSLDIVTANVSGMDGTVATLFNRGDGSFAAVEDVATENAPLAVAIGDVDNDALPDIIVTRDGGTLATYSALRGGGFQAPRVFQLGDSVRPLGVAVADINGDGFLDVAFTDNDMSRVGVVLGRRNGAFTAPTFFGTASNPVAVAIGDFDGDGKLDLAVTNNSGPPGQLSKLSGRGDGTFNPFTVVSVDAVPNYIVAGDFNGDGRDDIAVLNVGGDNVSVVGRTISLIISGSGTVQSLPTGATFPAAIAVGYFGPDTALDLLFGSTSVAGSEATVHVWTNNMTTPVSFTSIGVRAGDSALGLAVRDFDGDLLQDVVTAEASDNAAALLNGTASAAHPLQLSNSFGVSRMPVSSVAADFNGDGCYDAATLDTDNSSRCLSVLTNICTLPIPRGDANGDGKVSAADAIAVALEVMDGDGTAVELIGGGSYQAQPTVDNNGDGTMDTKDVLGVDANGDGLVNAQDASAAGRLIFSGRT